MGWRSWCLSNILLIVLDFLCMWEIYIRSNINVSIRFSIVVLWVVVCFLCFGLGDSSWNYLFPDLAACFQSKLKLLERHVKSGWSTEWTTSSEVGDSNSKMTRLFSPCLSTGVGTQRLHCGPVDGQNLPMLNSLTNAIPLSHPLNDMNVFCFINYKAASIEC